MEREEYDDMIWELNEKRIQEEEAERLRLEAEEEERRLREGEFVNDGVEVHEEL